MLANFIAFQIGWFACVLGAARDLTLPGSLIALLVIAWHLKRCASAWTELRLILIAALTGIVFDSVPVWMGWISYESGTFIRGVAPYWIVILWMLFATTLNASLSWLKHSIPLAASGGAVAGPLAYWGGAQFGALNLEAFVPAMLTLCIGWALLTPALLRLASAFNGYARSGPNFSRVASD
jgi:Protein of unknown function (DUF2878)